MLRKVLTLLYCHVMQPSFIGLVVLGPASDVPFSAWISYRPTNKNKCIPREGVLDCKMTCPEQHGNVRLTIRGCVPNTNYHWLKTTLAQRLSALPCNRATLPRAEPAATTIVPIVVEARTRVGCGRTCMYPEPLWWLLFTARSSWRLTLATVYRFVGFEPLVLCLHTRISFGVIIVLILSAARRHVFRKKVTALF